MQTYKKNLVEPNHTEITDIVERLNAAHHESKQVAIDQFEKAKKMGSANLHLKFKDELETKIEQTFSEWKIAAKHDYEMFLKRTRETQENARLKQDYETAIRNVQTIKEKSDSITKGVLVTASAIFGSFVGGPIGAAVGTAIAAVFENMVMK
ncbi:unnamed protein product [Diamesa tonsa]